MPIRPRSETEALLLAQVHQALEATGNLYRYPSSEEFYKGLSDVQLLGAYRLLQQAVDHVNELIYNRGVSAAIEPPFQYDTPIYDYEQWLSSVAVLHPLARHNKPGTPGHVPGYGEPEDEEFVVGPDMQADVVAVWNSSDFHGLIFQR